MLNFKSIAFCFKQDLIKVEVEHPHNLVPKIDCFFIINFSASKKVSDI